MEELLRSLGVCGLLIVVLAAGAIVVFVLSMGRRKVSWMPLILGSASLALGITGTLIARTVAMARVKELGGLASSRDVSEAASGFSIPAIVGVFALALGVTLTVVLHRRFGEKGGTRWRRRPRAPGEGGDAK